VHSHALKHGSKKKKQLQCWQASAKFSAKFRHSQISKIDISNPSVLAPFGKHWHKGTGHQDESFCPERKRIGQFCPASPGETWI
jgi:hypothetical protein